MSVWSEKFENHEIHQTLDQYKKALEVDAGEIDSEHEEQLRRLTKVVDMMIEIIEGMDPELVPYQQLDQFTGHLKQDQFLSQLSAYSSSPNVENLRAANNYITKHLPAIYQMSTGSTDPDYRKVIKAVEDAYDNFKQTIERRESEFEERLSESEASLKRLQAQTKDLKRALDGLKSNTDASLNGWQQEFTEAQTERAEEHSSAQIERSKEFEKTMRELRTKSDTELREISSKHEKQLADAFEKYTADVDNRLQDMQKKHEAILEIHGLVGTDGVAGGYQKGASDEHEAANRWRTIAMVSLGFTAAWVLVKYLFGFEVTPSGGVNWSEAITAVSLTLVLIAAAGYAARQSKLHRDAEQQMRWFALEVKAIDPFISSLPLEEQNVLKNQLSQRLFGQGRITSGEEQGSVDPTAFNTITDTILKVVKETLKR